MPPEWTARLFCNVKLGRRWHRCWDWLVDGPAASGYAMHLAHTAAVPQYAELKHGDDDSDARHLANLLRLGILPEGYVYPQGLASSHQI